MAVRVTFEILPGGDATKARVIGLIEMALQHVDENNVGSYQVVMKRTPPFKGALRHAWRAGRMLATAGVVTAFETTDDDELLIANVGGHHRTRRGVYDLLYRALVACGMDKRNPDA